MSDTLKISAFDSAYPGSMCERESGGYVERDDADSLAGALLALIKSADQAAADAIERASDLERQLSAVTAERDALQNALLRNGFTQCDIAACNCGSWHHRYGLPERWEEIKDTLREADVLDNSVGNLPLNAIKRLVTERDARQEANRQESAAMALLLERECQDGDRLAEALGVPRTEGGSLQVQRMLSVIYALKERLQFPPPKGKFYCHPDEVDDWLARKVDAERLAWRPIETAPQDGVLLLWFPVMAAFVAGPWRGCWSYLCDEWVIHTPYSAGEKAIVASALPQPTHWMPLPPAIDAARAK